MDIGSYIESFNSSNYFGTITTPNGDCNVCLGCIGNTKFYDKFENYDENVVESIKQTFQFHSSFEGKQHQIYHLVKYHHDVKNIVYGYSEIPSLLLYNYFLKENEKCKPGSYDESNIEKRMRIDDNAEELFEIYTLFTERSIREDFDFLVSISDIRCKLKITHMEPDEVLKEDNYRHYLSKNKHQNIDETSLIKYAVDKFKKPILFSDNGIDWCCYTGIPTVTCKLVYDKPLMEPYIITKSIQGELNSASYIGNSDWKSCFTVNNKIFNRMSRKEKFKSAPLWLAIREFLSYLKDHLSLKEKCNLVIFNKKQAVFLINNLDEFKNKIFGSLFFNDDSYLLLDETCFQFIKLTSNQLPLSINTTMGVELFEKFLISKEEQKDIDENYIILDIFVETPSLVEYQYEILVQKWHWYILRLRDVAVDFVYEYLTMNSIYVYNAKNFTKTKFIKKVSNIKEIDDKIFDEFIKTKCEECKQKIFLNYDLDRIYSLFSWPSYICDFEDKEKMCGWFGISEDQSLKSKIELKRSPQQGIVAADLVQSIQYEAMTEIPNEKCTCCA